MMKTEVLTKDIVELELQESLERVNKVQDEIDKLDMFVLTTNIPISEVHKMLDLSIRGYFDSFEPI